MAGRRGNPQIKFMKMRLFALFAAVGLLTACSKNNSSNPSSTPEAAETVGGSSTNSNNSTNAGIQSPVAHSITAGDGTAGTATAHGAAITQERAAEGETNKTENSTPGVPPAGTGSTSPTVNSNNVGHPQQ
jgi:hypothetical protein